ncbi:ExbD/TolR family protein [Chitinophaga japonensis]|uniref:Outer membrane transport energization protein ExbD (TC 2.C.1.1.1) n=1 Tax=Chitinophaga japonensis TaxID=104662 RepID=A0A562TFC9_CHIJA|nr:biopolymer transporter ExbD [Chitinophaga japonensis]TWI91974.1 outer membrane transport energization protein ExbD (TC 2.C.1.1.1) [Chitinophaga japonensis]
MAEINTAATGRGQGGVRRKVLSTRVDMTPMVDLGFLLITFFMLATTLAAPKAMDLALPRNDGDSMQLADSKALTIMLGGNNRIAYYEGMGNDPARPPQVRHTSFAMHKGIGDVIRAKRRQVMERHGKNELMVLIKADSSANYRNMVDIMDEMLINDVPRYALVALTPAEQEMLR